MKVLLTPARIEFSVSLVLAEDLYLHVRTTRLAFTSVPTQLHNASRRSSHANQSCLFHLNQPFIDCFLPSLALFLKSRERIKTHGFRVFTCGWKRKRAY